MRTHAFDGVEVFVTVAETASFTASAHRLGITPTAVSKAVRQLESRNDVVLFTRTTRSVALTEAGKALYASVGPAAAEISDAFASLVAFRDQPSGVLRITVPRALGLSLLVPIIKRFHALHREVTLDISLDDGAVDIVAGRYDAGVRLGQSVAQDMVAVRLTPDLGWSVVGAPSYFRKAGTPSAPEDLVDHETIRYRFLTSGALHRWKFARKGQHFQVETSGSIIANDTNLLKQLACDGVGLAYMPDREIADLVAKGKLVRVLDAFVPSTSGLYLYFPSRSQHQPKLRAFIDVARAATKS